MKQIIKSIAIGFVVSYLIVSFALLNINCFDWELQNRVTVIVLTAFISFLIFVGIQDN
jgi:hypothetical protein